MTCRICLREVYTDYFKTEPHFRCEDCQDNMTKKIEKYLEE